MTKQLTSTEAAARLGITSRRVLALIQAGRLKARRLGHFWVITERDLERLGERIRGRPPKQNGK